MARWSVYIIKRKPRKEAVGIGYVNATHSADALMKAWAKWPEHKDDDQTQFGFRAVPYKSDKMALGHAKKNSEPYAKVLITGLFR